MKDMYEEYVKPPSYVHNNVDKDDLLISKLRMRIQQDLNQINGVYDLQISESEHNKNKKIKNIESEHLSSVENINKQRKEDIFKYNEKAEQYIDNLISTMNDSNQQKIQSWWDYFVSSMQMSIK
jgi:hypothetical protein